MVFGTALGKAEVRSQNAGVRFACGESRRKMVAAGHEPAFEGEEAKKGPPRGGRSVPGVETPGYDRAPSGRD